MNFKEFCRVLSMESEAIQSALERFKDAASEKNIQAILSLLLKHSEKGGKILVIGLGKSGKIGAKIAATLSSCGTPSIYIHPTEALHGDLGVLGVNDVALAISYTGNTEEIVHLIPYFKKRQIPVIAMTGSLNSKLSELSQYVIDCSVSEEACAHNLAPTSSTTLTLAIGDALAIALMKARGFTAEDFAKNHPGGALGRRLQLKVEDLMHPIPLAPVVTRKTQMDTLLSLSTEKKLGAVLVCEGKNLVGIVTDGDIRRALKHREKLFSLCAEDVMTAHPTVVTPELLAYDALRIMEERESQISVLPVVSTHGVVMGLLRIHDLVQTF